MSKTALICGVSGQDGSLLAKFLLEKGYQVFGTSRAKKNLSNLKKLGIETQISVLSLSLTDAHQALQVMESVKPDEVYNLAGQSSVGLSFKQPVETIESHVLGTLYLLEAIRNLGGYTRFFNAGSGDCFIDTGKEAANEATPFSPRSPYAVAKVAAFFETKNYREMYHIYACTGIMFNHESPLRPESFVTKKIVQAACRIAQGSKEKLKLGNLTIRRDWGWAEEYVDAMWRMLQQDKAEDFVIATGQSHSLEDFVAKAFQAVGLDWKEHVEVDESLLREHEVLESKGDAGKAKEKLGWVARKKLQGIVFDMIQSEKNIMETNE